MGGCKRVVQLGENVPMRQEPLTLALSPASGERGRGERNVTPGIDRRKVRISVTVNWKGAASLLLPACGEIVRAGG